MEVYDLQLLHQLIVDRVSFEELRTASFAVELNYDDLPGDGKQAKARELLSFLYRRERLTELIAYLQAFRPDLPLVDAQQAVEETAVEQTAVLPRTPDILLAQEQLRRALAQRRLCLFIGADLPADLTGVPSRQTLANGLADSAQIEPGLSWAETAELVMGGNRRYEFTMYLRQQLGAVDKTVLPFHKSIVGLVGENELETIFTTAYDGGLERAFHAEGLSLNTVVANDDLRVTLPDLPTLIKLYGDWRQPASLIVTRQDENQFLRERNWEKQDLVTELRRAFRRQTMLFVGVDISQTAVVAFFDEIAGSQFQRPAFALWPGLSTRATTAWQSNRGLTVLDVTVVPFLQSLLASL